MSINVFRVVAVKFPVLGKRLITVEQARLCCLLIFAVVPFAALPAFWMVELEACKLSFL